MKNLSLEEMKIAFEEVKRIADNYMYANGSEYLIDDIKKQIAAKGKELAIVEAVNKLRATTPCVGVYVFINKVGFQSSEISRTICDKTICNETELMQCIKELSEACWMNPHDEGEPMHYETYKLAWHDMQEAEKAELKHQEVDYLGDEWRNGDACEISGYCGEWVYGCDVPNSLTCIVFKRSSHMVIPKPRLSKPQTAEQKAAIEREEKLELYCKFVSDSLIDELAQMLIDLGAEIK
jgi:hypothetical protein